MSEITDIFVFGKLRKIGVKLRRFVTAGIFVQVGIQTAIRVLKSVFSCRFRSALVAVHTVPNGIFIQTAVLIEKSFFTVDGFFQVTIFNANYGVEAESDNLQEQNASVNASVKLNETQKAILQCMQDKKNVTLKELVVLLGKNESTIARNIKALKEKGLIERVGSDKTGYWKVF